MALTATVLFWAAAPPPESPVADAAMRGNAAAVRALLARGADVNAPQGDGMTALHWAAEHGNLDIATMLIYAGAKVDAGTRIGSYTPLHLAAKGGHARVVAALLEAGADPLAASTNSGTRPLHLAAASGDPASIAALLDHGANPNVRESAWNQTPLIFAAANNRAAAIRLLIERGADPDLAARVVDVPERAEADEAAAERLDEVLEGFRENDGADAGWQPTSSQVQAALQEAREVLRSWPDRQTDAEVDSAQSGVEAGPETEGGEDVQAEPAAETEAEEGEEEAGEEEEDGPQPLSYEELIGEWGGMTPLLHAARQGHVDATLALLDGGADINQVSAGDGTSPLLMAAVNGQFDLGMLLLERGADPNLASQAGTTPLYAALERQWAPKASYAHPVEHQQQRTTYLDFMEALLEAGADPNVRLKKHLWYMQYTFDVLDLWTGGATPFWRAAYALDVDAMRLLLAHGADPDVATRKPPERRRRGEDEEAEEEEEAGDPSGLAPVPIGGPAVYPIHAASGVGYGEGFAANAHRHAPGAWLPAIELLVEETGADVNARDLNGYTALHHAAARGDNAMILYLVEHGADVTAVSREGQTTADMANGPVQRVQPFPDTVELLESLGSKNNHNCLSC